MKIYRYTFFRSNAFGHGGEKRTQQISEFLEKAGIQYTLLFPIVNSKKERLSRFLSLIGNFRFIRSLEIPLKSIKQYWLISSAVYFAKKEIKSINTESIIIYEHSFSLNWFVPILLNKRGHKIIAFPHNLETLVSGQKSKISDQLNPLGFFDEILVLKCAKLVLVISKEEEWLLNLFNINSVYYPYIPTIQEEQLLNEIRSLRDTHNKTNQYLILGSASNPPTRSGIIELLTNLRNDETGNLIFHIAGFLTENICEELELSERFIFHGSVNLSKLHELYKKVDGVILHQKPSSGSLTKIPELLLAGLPVIANNHAARNFYNQDGVFVYRTFDELKIILSDIDKLNKPIIFKDEMDIQRILLKIKEVIED
jgi:hypothetical protein